MLFKGEGKNVRVISAYRPVKSCRVRRRGADLHDRLGTVWEQHVRHFGDLTVDPRKRFDKDLLEELTRWRDEGDEIILMMDANQHIYDGKLGRALRSDLQLADAYFRMYDDHDLIPTILVQIPSAESSHPRVSTWRRSSSVDTVLAKETIGSGP